MLQVIVHLAGWGQGHFGISGLCQNIVFTGFPLMTEPYSLAKMGRAEAV